MYRISTPQRHAPAGFAGRRLSLLTSAAALSVALGLGGAYAVAQQATATAPAPVQAQPVTLTQASAPTEGFADLVEKVKPAVISVQVKIKDEAQSTSMGQDMPNPFPPGSPLEKFFRQFGAPGMPQQPQGQMMGQGSGFFISADGYAVTNNHVVDHANSVEVVTDAGKTYTARVIGTDAKTDLALIKVEGNDFAFVKFADHEPRVGDWVVAIGNPYGLGGTVTAGIVSAEGRDIGSSTYDNFIQIDAPINKGNSGGPAFDLSGNVVGINTAIFSPSGGSIGIGFDIPATTAKVVISQIKDKGHVTRGWLGVQVQTITPDIAAGLGLSKPEGALVDLANAGSPAGKAGLKAGDVIIALDGATIKDSRDLAQKVGGLAPGTAVDLKVMRNGKSESMHLTLAEMPDEKQAQAAPDHGNATDNGSRLGLALAPAGQVAGDGKTGVAVLGIDPNGPAADSGLQVGDVILDAAGKAVSTPADITKAVQQVAKQGRQAVLLRVKSSDGLRFVAVPLKKA